MTRTRTLQALLAAMWAFSSTCGAQWYQGPAGGHGGSYFDDWKQQGQRRDLSYVATWIDSSNDARCFYVGYKGLRSLSPLHGYCPTDPSQPAWDLTTQGKGVVLGSNEYLTGIAFRYDDHVNAIRFYTNKRTLPWFGNADAGDREVGFTAPRDFIIVGFVGRAGDNLDGLGVIYGPKPKSPAELGAGRLVKPPQ